MPSDWPILLAAVVLVIALIGLARRRRAMLGVCDARRNAEPADEANVLKRVKSLLNAQRDA